MIKISAKLITNQKVRKSINFISVDNYESDNFYFYVSEICRRLDLSTPIIINYHRECYEKFNSLKFTKEDFFDDFNYDYLFLENQEE
ncbi:MAG: hypothetical protein IJW26_01395 [Clostridia bacterium]|jgi:hypothetical protein|nr:hypothetical protein [Clostridia bacterium]